MLSGHTERTLHLLDPENLLGHGQPTQADVARLRADYMEHVTVAPGDLVVLAASGANSGLAMGLAWPSARLRWMPGTDGADNCLLDVIAEEDIAKRFSRVVIGSGDHAFAPAVTELATSGVTVTVVTGLGQVAADLYCAAHRHIKLAALTTAA